MSAPVLRYARWQGWDHLRGAGLVIGAGAVLIGFILWRVSASNPGAAGGAEAMLPFFLAQLGWPLVLLVTSGMVSGDRVEGYYRALFSAPVSPTGFYLQRYLLGGAVLATLPVALAVAVWASLGAWVAPWTFVGILMLYYLVLGGLVFCWSTIGRRDWAIGLTIYFAHGTITSAERAGATLPAWVETIYRVLPPFHLLDFGGPGGDGVRPPVLPAGVTEWAHLVGYGVALLGIGVVVLRLRPMGSGGRG